MFYIENNKHLWEDQQSFGLYKTAISMFLEEMNNQKKDIDQITLLADGLDQLFQSYEEKYGDMKDPLFYWWFASVNAVLTAITDDDDSFMRKQYAVNGFKTSLSRHFRVPSFSQEMIDQAFSVIESLEPGVDGRGWVQENRRSIKPAF